MKVTNYDEFEYDYSTYWKHRNYEHFAEVLVLKKFFLNKNGDWFLDIGGSFGRHLPIYYKKFKKPIILDYSLNTLINNRDRILEKYPNTTLISANVYFLPFKESVFDGAMMVRVIHHIEDVPAVLGQIQKILRNKAGYIQEFANKMHIKAVIRHLLKRDFSFFSTKSFQQPTQAQFEGSNGMETTFQNFHPKYIQQELVNKGFEIKKKCGVSFFRISFIKRALPIKVLIFLESLAQVLFGRTNISPSIFLDCEMKKKNLSGNKQGLEDILICPKCNSELSFKKEDCVCTKCKNRYEKVAGIWDFRVQ